MKYVPALDGIRALAVLLVLAFHARLPWVMGGHLGVDMFFVLSGYLITTLLLQEKAEQGKVNLWRFYARRLLRLYPALLLAIGLYAGYYTFYAPGEFARGAWVAGLYLTDIAMAIHAIGDNWMLLHTWSLAVEAHYYMLWPALLLFLARFYQGKKLLAALAGLCAAAALWRAGCALTSDNYSAIFYRFDVRIAGLLAGGVLAVYMREGGRIPYSNILLAVFAAAAAYCAATMPGGDMRVLWLAVPVAEIFTGLLIYKIVQEGPAEGQGRVAKLLALPPVVFIGKISYAWYLFHYLFSFHSYQKWFENLVFLTFVPGFALAVLSYFTVEYAARRVGRRLAGGIEKKAL